MIQMHGGIGLCQIVCVILVELGGLARNFSCHSALVATLQPEQIQGETSTPEFLVDIGIIGHLVDRLGSAGRKQTL